MSQGQKPAVYVRTKEKVLLRFSDLEGVRQWIEKGRLSLEDEYLAPDETWQPLRRLFRVELASAAEPDQKPTVPTPPVEAGPKRLFEHDEGKPAKHDWTVGATGEPGADMWGPEPDIPEKPKGKKILKVGFAVGGFLCGVAIVSIALYQRSSEEPQSVEQQPPPVSAPQAEKDLRDVVVFSKQEPDIRDALEEDGRNPEAMDVTLPDKAPERAKVSTQPAREASYEQHMREGLRLAEKDPQKALAHFQAASQVRPWSVEPVVKVGECQLRLGRYREAASLFQKALNINPNYGPAIAGLARAHARLGNTNDAKVLYMRYLELHPYGSHAAEARAFLGR